MLRGLIQRRQKMHKHFLAKYDVPSYAVQTKQEIRDSAVLDTIKLIAKYQRQDCCGKSKVTMPFGLPKWRAVERTKIYMAGRVNGSLPGKEPVDGVVQHRAGNDLSDSLDRLEALGLIKQILLPEKKNGKDERRFIILL